ncbi:MAG: phage tail protein [Micromonosporaceae bacterium]|nr:phage tail protein [Micromonosporaceae bacterium]
MCLMPRRSEARRGMSARGAVEGLPSAFPVLRGLPSIYHDQDFTRRFTAAFDEALAPVFTTLDCLETYLDPALAPPDFVEWLAHWVGVVAQLPVDERHRRRLVASAADLYSWRGTVRGLRETVRLLTGAEPEIVEPGQPGSSGPYELVLRVLRVDGLDLKMLRTVISAGVPAHLTWRIELTEPEERTAVIQGRARPQAPQPPQPPPAPQPLPARPAPQAPKARGRARPQATGRARPQQPPAPPPPQPPAPPPPPQPPRPDGGQ